MGDHISELVVFQQSHGTGVQDDERLVHAIRTGVYQRGLRHEERVLFRRVECREALLVDRIHLPELVLTHADCVRLERETNRLLAEKAEDLLEYLIEDRNLA